MSMTSNTVNMSDNEDLLGDDLDQLADYNLGNEEEEQLLADDQEASSHNVPTSAPHGYEVLPEMVTSEYTPEDYTNQQYHTPLETECVVPNIVVEVPNVSLPETPTYAPYNDQSIPYESERMVPPAIPAAPLESPQIVPSDILPPVTHTEISARERFTSERPAGSQRMPQIRDIPDTLDKVFVPRGGFNNRGRTSWRNPQFQSRFSHPYRRNNVHWNNNYQRQSFPPHNIRPSPPQIRLEIRPEIRQEIRPEIHQDINPETRHEIRHEFRPEHPPEQISRPPSMGPEISPERPILPQQDLRMPFRPDNGHFQHFRPRFPQFRPMEDQRQNFRPNFEQRPMYPYQRPPFNPRPFAPPLREIASNNVSHIPQVTIRQTLPGVPLPANIPKIDDFAPKVGGSREQEVRMLPVQLPNLPPGSLPGKKVLINPHFKGNFQPPSEGVPTYIPTRIQKSPPLSPTLESKFGPIKDIDDAAERFIAEQRNALARAAGRKMQRRSPQRFIENTTIEIENELAVTSSRRHSEEELLRRQEEFINANREGLRRRMRTPSPPPPARSPERRAPHSPHQDEESEYRRRLRAQESLRERVLRAKEVRRRKNAVALHKQLQERERGKEKVSNLVQVAKPSDKDADIKPTSTEQDNKPDTTKSSPERDVEKNEVVIEKKERDRSPVKKEIVEVNSTCETLTPPRESMPTPEAALTPPLPPQRPPPDSDDDLDLILDDIDDILSDDDDTGRFKEKATKYEPQKVKPQVDLRSKLPPKSSEDNKKPKQKIVFNEKDDKKKKEKSPVRKAVVTSSTKTDDSRATEKKSINNKKSELSGNKRQRITFDKKEPEKQTETQQKEEKPKFTNRRVILQRKVTQEKTIFTRIDKDPSKPHPGIFTRAVRTAIGSDRIITKKDEPTIEYESGSDIDEDKLLEDPGFIALVKNLPFGMTDTRLKTLAGNDVQSLTLNKDERTANITFKNTTAAEAFKKKFNNKMVAASRLTVTIQ